MHGQLITKETAHVVEDQNLFVSFVCRQEGDHNFFSEFIDDGSHPYLYEDYRQNPEMANNVSGTRYIDTCRQLLKAIMHIYYDVPLAHRFVIQDMDVCFPRWSKLNVPVEIHVELDVDYRPAKSGRWSCESRFECFQEGEIVAKAVSKFTAFSEEQESKFMQAQYTRRDPLKHELGVV